MSKPNFRVVGQNSELFVSIDVRSWHILDNPDFFEQGGLLRRAFGMNFIAGLGKQPAIGVLQSMPAAEFRTSCETVWQLLLRDKELLSHEYSYEFEREKGRKQGGRRSGFKVRGLCGDVSVRPTGY